MTNKIYSRFLPMEVFSIIVKPLLNNKISIYRLHFWIFYIFIVPMGEVGEQMENILSGEGYKPSPIFYAKPWPLSFSDTHVPDEPITRWSSTSMSSSLPAWTMARVTATSSGLGEGSPLGWLCMTIIAATGR